jgi:predicted dithiol-disulfide oxidoreductase (DUF899 family)
MMKHMTGTREEWLAARLELLKAEKELTRRSGAVAAGAAVGSDRQGVSIRDRRGERLAGGPLQRALAAPRLPLHVRARLRGGVSVLLVDRRRFQRVVHLENHDVAFSAASRAPLAKPQAYKRRMGWAFPWASSRGSDFNFDFNVSFTEEQQREWLDRAPKGRNETGAWFRRHDEYGKR